MANATVGTNERELPLVLGVTGWLSIDKAAVAVLIPESGSLNPIEIVGVAVLTYPPFAGEFKCKSGGVVSVDANEVMNAAVWALPPKETAPLTVTV